MTDQVYKADALIAQDIDAYLESHQNKSLLRFITCGSVDDGPVGIREVNDCERS